MPPRSAIRAVHRGRGAAAPVRGHKLGSCTNARWSRTATHVAA